MTKITLDYLILYSMANLSFHQTAQIFHSIPVATAQSALPRQIQRMASALDSRETLGSWLRWGLSQQAKTYAWLLFCRYFTSVNASIW